MKAQRKKVMVEAPDGYHWVIEGGRYYLGKGTGKRTAPFKLKQER